MADQILDNRFQVADADTEDPGGAGQWTDEAHANMNQVLNVEVFVEGTGSISEKASGNGTETGLGWDYEADTNLTGSTMYMWANMGAATKLQLKSAGGLMMRFTGATASDYFEVFLDGSDTYGGGFKMFVVDVDLASANPDQTSGTPPATTAINWVGIVVTTNDNIAGNDDNFFVDAFWTLADGVPGIIVEGQNGGLPWTFEDIVDAADVNDPAKAWGTVSRIDGVIFLNTPIQFGLDDGDDDEFSDAGEVIFWQNQLVKDTFYGFSILANTAGAADLTWGSKVGSGDSAAGVNGMVIGTGGPRWFFTANDADQDSVSLFGCTFKGSGPWSVAQTNVEIRSCVFGGCDQLIHNNGVTIAKCFFDAAPGPLAQVRLDTDPSSSDFFENSFTNMDWWGIEISENGPVTYTIRGMGFSDNGTDRDILLSHNSGLITLAIVDSPNGVASDTPGVTNGAAVTITTSGASDIRMSAVSLDNVNQSTPIAESDGNSATNDTAALTAAVTANDANSYLAAFFAANIFGTVDWSGGSAYVEEVEAQDVLNSATTGGSDKEGVTGLQTASAAHDGVLDLSAMSVLEVDNEAASPVIQVDPEWRPIDKTLASTTHVFSYGVPGETSDLAALVFVHTQDDTLADSNVTSVSWGGNAMTEVREDLADPSSIEPVDAAIAESPSTSFSDETAGANNATTADVTLLANPTAVNDAYYVGDGAIFDRVVYDISTGATGTHTLVWEYWNGGSWVAVAGLTDGTSSFTNTGAGLVVTFTLPTDWATTTVNSQGPFYYLRTRTSAFTSGGNALGDEIDIGGGGGSNSLRSTAFRLIGSNLRPGTFSVDASVSVAIFGVTEGARVIIERTDTDVELLNELAYVDDGQGGFQASASFAFVSDTPVRVSAASSGKPVSAASDNNDTFVDETVNANSASTLDMTLLPVSPVAGEDGYVFGHTEQFGQMDLVIDTVGTGGFTITWEYWNGSIWTALSGVSDGTSSFTNLGTGRVSWTIPGGWTARTTATQPGSTSLFYIRASYSAGSVTILPVGRQVTMDVIKYLRREDSNTVTSSGLAVKATWVIDTIASF